MIASVVSIIPAVLGGIAGASAPIGALTIMKRLKLSSVTFVLVGMVIAIASGAAAGAIIASLIPKFAAHGAALGAGVGTITGIVSLSSYHFQVNVLEATD